MTVSEQRDGTGTGVWTHPAAVEQREQREQQEPKRCECGACGGRGHIERGGEIWMCATCNGTGHVPYEAPRCECRACRWDGMRWVLDVEYSYDYDGHEQRGTTAERVDTCPKTCGCRLSVVDGEPVVGLSQGRLLAALALELGGHEDCPGEFTDWTCPATLATHNCEAGPVELCWLLYYGLAATYAEAQALWKRMEAADDAG